MSKFGQCGQVLRPGAVTEEMLAEVAPYVTTDTHLVTGKGVPKAPGMKYRHYAPEAPVTGLRRKVRIR